MNDGLDKGSLNKRPAAAPNSATRKQQRIVAICSAFILLSSCTYFILRNMTNVDGLPNRNELIGMTLESVIKEERIDTSSRILVYYSKQAFIDESAKKICLSQRPYLKEVDPDSLFNHDSTWINDKTLSHALISIDSMSRFGNTVTITAHITRAPLSGKGYEVVFKRRGKHYYFIEQRIVWIS